MESDNHAEENFEDAVENVTPASEMDLETAIEETKVALNLFLNNRFELAKAKMEPWCKESMYHSLGYATIVFIKALMTCEQQDIEQAVQITKQASKVCDRFRRCRNSDNSLKKLVRNFDKGVYEYTDEQMHAELCYAETLLQRALLTFIQDENFVSFVKAAFQIRSCYQSYRDCQRLLHESDAWPKRNVKLRAHYESGVRMGIGTFNLMISTLPSRILGLLEIVGFSGDKTHGLQLLEAGSAGAEETLRGPLCSLILLAWHLVFTFLMSTGDGDLSLCEKLLTPLQQNYPKGSLVLFFAGRLAEVQARMSEAITLFHDSISAQSEWRQFHHLCYWELTFCYAYKRQWSEAAKYAYKLYEDSRWSKVTYSYMCAVFLLAKDEYNANGCEKEKVRKLLAQLPDLKMRIAGKSIPMEKYCIMKANQFEKKGCALTFAHYELLYFWNAFNILGQDPELIQPILQSVETVLQRHAASKKLDADDYCLCLLLKAMCLKHLQSPFQGGQCLSEILTFEKQLLNHSFLIPSAYFELCLLKVDEENFEQAKRYLMKAREYKGYAMESRLHFRMHALNHKLSTRTP